MNISERMPRHKQMRPIGDLEDPKFNIPIRNLAEEFETMEETPVVADLPSANSPDVPTPGPDQGMGSDQNQAAEMGPGPVENMVESPSLPAAELPIADMNIIDQAPNQLVEPMIVNYVPLPEYELLTEPFDIDNLAVPSELYQKGKCQFNTFNLN